MRLLLAVFLPTIIVFFAPVKWEGLWSFTYSFPVVIFCVGFISKDTSVESRNAGALAFLIPAIGYTAWKNAIISMDSEYISPQLGAIHQLEILNIGLEGLLVLLFSTTLAAVIWKATKMSILIGCSFFTSLICYFCLRNGAYHLWYGSPETASTLCLVTEICRFLPIITVFALIRGSSRVERWLLVVGGVVGAWIVTPLATFQFNRLPIGIAHPDGPSGEAGVGVSMPAADPLSPQFVDQLNAQGTLRLPTLQWWCNTKPRKYSRMEMRAASAIAPKAGMTVGELRPFLPEIYVRGVTLLVIVGRSENSALPPLGAHVKNPGVRFLLEPPPLNSSYGIIRGGVLEWVAEDPTEGSCAVWVDDSTTMDRLFSIGQKFGDPSKPCAFHFHLMFGSPQSDIRKWKSPMTCIDKG